MSTNRFVAVVPGQGSAYYREPGGALMEAPMLAGGEAELCGHSACLPGKGQGTGEREMSGRPTATGQP